MKLLQEHPTTRSKGILFDIKHFATHDGKGIRTTVFLKGCPLHCIWCQNPEGIHPYKEILYLENNCIHCNSCVHTSFGAVECINHQIIIHREKEDCWDQITDICPTLALSVAGKEYTIEEVMQEILKDEAFYKYGGGVTLSGGEPFYQVDYIVDILKACKERNIHTAIESSFFTEKENIEKVLPYLDQIYCDCKLSDDVLHKKYTGVSNKIIKENIRFLLTSDKKDQVIIRTPLIPNCTADKENIRDIALYISSIYKEVNYELLNYNPLAKGKYAYLNKTYALDEDLNMYSPKEMEAFYQIARENGIKHLIIES